MSDGASRYADELEDLRTEKNRKWLEDLADRILKINSAGTDFDDIQWLVENKDRIIGNRELIKLLR